jgi:hypothetical protein
MFPSFSTVHCTYIRIFQQRHSIRFRRVMCQSRIHHSILKRASNAIYQFNKTEMTISLVVVDGRAVSAAATFQAGGPGSIPGPG